MAISTTFTLKFAGAAVEKGIKRISSAFGSLGGLALRVGKSLISPFAGIAAAAGGLLATGALAKTAMELNEIGEQAYASEGRLEAIAKSMGVFGYQTDKVVSRLIDLGDEQARLLGIDDDTIRLTQSKLMTFREIAKTADKAGGAFDRATMAAIDMAGAGFGTAEMNAVQLGKALNDPIKGISSLTRSGITFTTQEKEKIKTLVESNRILSAQDMILKAIELQVGGAARATSTASGRMKQSWEQIKEEFAKPFSIELGAIFDRIGAKIPQLASEAKAWGQAVGRTMTQLVDAFEQGRLGEVVQTALMAGVTRAGEEMIAAMIFAGNALYDTIAERLKGSDLGKMFNITEPLKKGQTSPAMFATPLGIPMAMVEKGMAIREHFQAKGVDTSTYQQTREGFRDALDSSRFVNQLKETMQKQGPVPGVEGYRYARPGEPASIMDGERVVRILTSIERNLAPVP